MTYPDWVYKMIAEESGTIQDVSLSEIDTLVTQLVAYARKARREGLLSLEQETEGAVSPLLKLGLQLVVDGIDPSLTRQIMTNCVLRHGTGLELLKDLLITEGILRIQEGTNPSVLAALLLSYIGPEAAMDGYTRN
jgi:flagellar motor component MotA